MKVKTIVKKFVDYVKSHMSFGLIGTGIVLFFSAALIFNRFLQQEYMQYLLAETTKTENAVLNASATNMNSMIQDTVVACADIAVDRELYRLVENVLENDEDIRDIMILESKLNSITHYNNYIVGTTIVTEDGLLREYGRYWSNSGYDDLWKGESLDVLTELYKKVMKRAENKDVVCYEVSTTPLLHQDFSEMIFFHLAYPLVGDKVRKTDSCAVVVFTMRLDVMIKSSALANVEQSEYITQFITDSDNVILYGRSTEVPGEKENMAESAGIKELKKELDYLSWTIHINIDTNEMEETVQTMFERGIGVYLILLFMCIIVWQVLLWRILRPVGVIGKAMEKTRKGELNEKIEIEGTHELWQLAKQYNRTVDALIEQRKETKREYDEKTLMLQKCNAAEKEALESQINAHFLCNTLGAINYSAMENGDMEVSELLKNLSGILYYAFSREMKTVTLGYEIKWVHQYLYLQKFRLMDVFDYEIDFPEEYGEWPCCKLFLQPFVENSIMHGFCGWERNGKIMISATEQQGRLVVNVADNGMGMSDEKKEKIQEILSNNAVLDCEKIGIGISNVVARLRMYYGPELEIQFETKEGKGTSFTFWLPIPADMLKDSMEISEEEIF